MLCERPAVVLLLSIILCAPVFAQAPAGSPAAKSLEEYRNSKAALLRDDFGELSRYRDANAALKPPVAGEKRVVFFGDSITDIWPIAKYFPGKPYVNRGIGGQTTPQMLIRFRDDVINLQPSAVVILAGTNDIAGNTGAMTLEDIEGNYASLAELARAHNIRVVFSSVLPSTTTRRSSTSSSFSDRRRRFWHSIAGCATIAPKVAACIWTTSAPWSIRRGF